MLPAMGSRSIAHTSLVFGLLVVTTGCNLTKKDSAEPTTAAVVVPAAPVFNVAIPQGGAAAAATPLHVEETHAKLASGGATHQHSGTAGAAATAKGGAAAAASAAAPAATGGTPAVAPAATVPAIKLPDQACLSKCAADVQTCLAGAGMDAAKLTACQQSATTCTQGCTK